MINSCLGRKCPIFLSLGSCLLRQKTCPMLVTVLSYLSLLNKFLHINPFVCSIKSQIPTAEQIIFFLSVQNQDS